MLGRCDVEFSSILPGRNQMFEIEEPARKNANAVPHVFPLQERCE